ncbi:hypothetical protein ASA1KI_11180 [Opitutales bacterium ASA1]|nr:hypothetical protein ASA1KI_11180 [Opitutales bacterium ASA1]
MTSNPSAGVPYASCRRCGQVSPALGAVILTVLLFAAVPLANLFSIPPPTTEFVPPENASLLPPPPPVEPPPPPTVDEPPEEKPKFEDEPQKLTLDQIDAIINARAGSNGADFGLPSHLGDVDALEQLRDFDPGQIDKIPAPLQRIAPAYPYELKQQGTSGWVKVFLVVDETGTPRNLRVDSSSHPGFETAALEAARLWRFSPGMLDGKPIRTRLVVPFHFRLER